MGREAAPWSLHHSNLERTHMESLYKYLILDIETRDGSPDEVERWMRTCWKPANNWKPETIGARYQEMYAKKLEKLALMDNAPICSIALKSDTETRCIHALYAHAPRQIGAALIEGYASEREMLVALRNLCDRALDANTILAGHNVRHFDLAHMRLRYLANGLRLPLCLVNPEQPVFDLMREYCSRFSHNSEIMVAMGDVLEALKLDNHKQIVDGADIGELIKAGKFDTVIQYNLLDVLAEEDVFKRMTGQAQDEAPKPQGQPKIERESAGELVSVGAPPTPAPATRKRSIE